MPVCKSEALQQKTMTHAPQEDKEFHYGDGSVKPKSAVMNEIQHWI